MNYNLNNAELEGEKYIPLADITNREIDYFEKNNKIP